MSHVRAARLSAPLHEAISWLDSTEMVRSRELFSESDGHRHDWARHRGWLQGRKIPASGNAIGWWPTIEAPPHAMLVSCPAARCNSLTMPRHRSPSLQLEHQKESSQFIAHLKARDRVNPDGRWVSLRTILLFSITQLHHKAWIIFFLFFFFFPEHAQHLVMKSLAEAK